MEKTNTITRVYFQELRKLDIVFLISHLPPNEMCHLNKQKHRIPSWHGGTTFVSRCAIPHSS